MTDRFFIAAAFGRGRGTAWIEVTRETWIIVERLAGFRPTLSTDDPAYLTSLATGGFSSSSHALSIHGTYTTDGGLPKNAP